MSAPNDSVLAASAYQTQTMARAQATGCAVLVKVIVPVSSGTVAQATDEIRGGVDGSRNTLAKLSAVIDGQAATILAKANRTSLINALVFG